MLFVFKSLVSPMHCTFGTRSLLHGIIQLDGFKFVADLPCSQRWRETNEEKRALERSNADMIAGARHSAEVHRQASVQCRVPLSYTILRALRRHPLHIRCVRYPVRDRRPEHRRAGEELHQDHCEARGPHGGPV